MILLFSSLNNFAQDKLFFRDGKVIPCKIVAISENTISYKDTIANVPLIMVSKNQVLLTEYQSGTIYMFSRDSSSISSLPDMDETKEQRKERKMKEWKEQEALLSNNILGFYITQLFLGRLTVSYERLFANKSMGIKIPLSLTYDALGALAEYSANNSSSGTTTSSGNNPNNVQRNRGTGIITGIDVNYYYDLKPQLKYYFGPRVRYGTDMILGGIEGLTFQLQNGIFKSRGKHITNTLGFGVGFFKLSQKYVNYTGYNPKQVYPWASFTWRLGFRL
ncbi:MAG: hypothetical protein JNM51_06715 [Bacteroidia bacterium]|nr:hypothetical protein [Bacteroidia bacterium]